MADIPQIFAQTVAEIGAPDHVLEHVNMFGKPSAKLPGGKPFLSFFQDCMVYKLSEARSSEIIAEFPRCQPYDPSGKGRPFKAWVQVPQGADIDWIAMGREALALQINSPSDAGN